MYEIPRINPKNLKSKFSNIFQNRAVQALVFVVVILFVAALMAGKVSVGYLQSQFQSFLQRAEHNVVSQLSPLAPPQNPNPESYQSKIDYEEAVIDSVKSASPSVVSIIISKNLPVYQQQLINPFEGTPFSNQFPGFLVPQEIQNGTQKQEIGAGSGFIISEDGLVLTNKHVVIDKTAEYTVLTNDGQKYSSSVMALDPVHDVALIKIKSDQKFPAIKIGDSNTIQIGQTAIAIGNALGQFRNTVSVGVISGLGRTVSASGGNGFSETIEDSVQTDAAINPGNSGGPLLNLKGEVVGINVATAEGAQSVGFAIPINVAKKDISQVLAQSGQTGTITISYPFIGVRYILVDDQAQQKYHLSVNYGALVMAGTKGEKAVVASSPAEKAGIKANDVILQLNGQKITTDNSMEKVIAKYNVGDTVTLIVLRAGKEINISLTLGERPQS